MRNPSAPTASTTATRSAAKGGGGGIKTACCSKVGLKRGPWTPEEDKLLSSYIKKEGEGRWRTLPKRAGLLRCGKSCRLRWMNYLRPCVKRGHIAPDEEDLILRLHRLLGNRWSLIAGRIPGRTDNEIKNYWNTHLSKKLISQGIDPRTHKPLDPHSVDQFKLASSSSKPTNRKSSSSSSSPKHDHSNNVFNNNNNQKIKKSSAEPSSNSGVEETTSIGNPVISNKENEYFDDNPNCNVGYKSLLNCSDDGCEMGMMGSIDNAAVNVNDEDEDINCGSDDVFSSFLNSLINEEAFTTQMQPQQLQVVNGILPASSSDPSISITASSFGLGHGWDSSLLSSTFSPNDHLHPSN